jgi:HJR/Mrr/RecB family endonuclease
MMVFKDAESAANFYARVFKRMKWIWIEGEKEYIPSKKQILSTYKMLADGIKGNTDSYSTGRLIVAKLQNTKMKVYMMHEESYSEYVDSFGL